MLLLLRLCPIAPMPLQKLMVSRAKSGYYPDSITGVPDSEPVRPVLHKHNGRIVYEFLSVLPVVRCPVAGFMACRVSVFNLMSCMV